ncbi:MAG: hypothetical protein HPY50_03320 [Firmicutes bacterium]|nr:hypothetical protein [Bacillota bacterium]
MFLLVDSIQKTLSIADGWTIGRLVIDGGVFLEQDNGRLIKVPEGFILEVKNGGDWQQLSGEDLTRTTAEGYPAYASMDARIKEARGRYMI